MAAEGLDLILTSGGLGPTEDDLTAEVVGGFAGREMVLDAALEERIAEILRPLMKRWKGLDPEAILASNRKQAVIPRGRHGPRSRGHRARPGRAPGRGPGGADRGGAARDRRASSSPCGPRR